MLLSGCVVAAARRSTPSCRLLLLNPTPTHTQRRPFSSSKKEAAAPTEEEQHEAKKSLEMERRMQALKKFGLPKQLDGDKGMLPQGKPLERKEGKGGEEKEEEDWDAIYGDYIWYREHQTTKGWKS